MITIFTPTYNRALLLPRLYESLVRQSCKNFEWLVVDDGSTDGTRDLIGQYISENKIHVRYIQQENQGKYRAINKGLNNAEGEYFFIVDSDDYLTDNALEVIEANLEEIKDPKFCGLIFNRIDTHHTTIGGEHTQDHLVCSLYDLKFKYGLNSDKAEIFKIDIIRNYPFPEFKGEKFSPEALIMFRMSGEYQILYINKGIYVGEYLAGGLTSSITKIRMLSPRGTTLYYLEQFRRAHNLGLKIKSAINFYRFRENDLTIEDELQFPYRMLKPAGKLLYLRDKKNISA